jgi:hypothetical protein
VNDLLTISARRTQLKALSLDEPLDDLWNRSTPPFRITGIFDHALGLLNERGDMIVLLTPMRLNGPHRLILDTPRSFTFSEWGLCVGDRFFFHEGKLCNFSRNIFISREGARRWSQSEVLCGLCRPAASLSATLAQATGFLKKNLRPQETFLFSSLLPDSGGKEEPEEVGEDFLYRRLREVFTPMRDGMRICDLQLIKESVEGALGLGRGLTPTGDDIVCGFINALHYSLPMARHFFGASRQLCSWFSEFIPGKSHLTTPVSYCSLKMAAEGRIAEEAVRFCRLIAGEDAGDFERGGTSLLSTGDSSGREMALGIIMGMSFALGDYCHTEEHD